MSIKLFIAGILVAASASVANAGKVDDIVTAAKSSCGKELPRAKAVKLIKRVFLTCKAGQRVDIGGCEVMCMKSNAGSVVGSN